MDQFLNYKNKKTKDKKQNSKIVLKSSNRLFKNIFEAVVVIILTLLFNFSYERMQINMNFCFMLLLSVFAYNIAQWWLNKVIQKKISQSIPHFLDLLSVSMSMGKSFAYAFKNSLVWQKGSLKDFYSEIFERIFVLREPKSGFNVQEWDNFYDFCFEVSTLTSNQLNKISHYRVQYMEKKRNEKKRQSIMTPIWIQSLVMGSLLFFVHAWNIFSKSFYFIDFLISLIWFAIGILVLTYMYLKRDNRV